MRNMKFNAGSTRTIEVDVRLIAQDGLGSAMILGRIPPGPILDALTLPNWIRRFAERREDIAPPVHHFARKAARRRMQKRIASIYTLASAPWPGNIRELENFIERCVILTQSDDARAAR